MPPNPQVIPPPRTTKPYFYPYTVKFDAANNGGTIANLATGNANINILNTGNFVLQQILAATFNAGVLVTSPYMFLMLIDLTSGNQIFDSSIPFPAICGDAKLPFILPAPRTIRSNAAIQVQVNNQDGGARQVYVTLSGQMVPHR